MDKRKKIKELVHETLLDLVNGHTFEDQHAGVVDFTKDDVDYLTNKISEVLFTALDNKQNVDPIAVLQVHVLAHFKMLTYAAPKFWENKEETNG